jgi:hypothetical protein
VCSVGACQMFLGKCEKRQNNPPHVKSQTLEQLCVQTDENITYANIIVWPEV